MHYCNDISENRESHSATISVFCTWSASPAPCPQLHVFLFCQICWGKGEVNWFLKLGFTCPGPGTVKNYFNCLENLTLMTQYSWVTVRDRVRLHHPFGLHMPSNLDIWYTCVTRNTLAMQEADFLLRLTALNGSPQTNEGSIYQGNLNQGFCKMYSAPITQLIRKVKAHFAHIYHSKPDPFNTITSLLCY